MTPTAAAGRPGRRRVAVTGVGVVAPCGVGVDAFWAGLHRAPEPGPRRVADYDPATAYPNPKEARRADRFQQFAVTAASEALAMSGDPGGDPFRRGVIIGTGIGGLTTLESQVIAHHEGGPRKVSPFLIPMVMGNAPAAAVSMRWGWQGPCETVVTACAAGTHAVINGARLVADGRCDAVLAGSTEAAMTPTGMQGFANMTALSGAGVSRPFDAARDGFVMAEGAAVLVLEDWDTAVDRGATVLAEVLGGASTADAHHLTAPDPEGAGARRCIELALEDAGITPGDVAQVNAHGTSTPRNDEAEAHALARVFGPGAVPVAAVKGVTGHALGAAGAIEAVATVLSLRHASIPPTFGTEAVDPALPDVDLVLGTARTWSPGPVVSNSFGFGGHNGCLVVAPA